MRIASTTEGYDYTQYTADSKKAVLRAATLAGSVKAILDTPILTEEGALTKESLKLTETIGLELKA